MVSRRVPALALLVVWSGWVFAAEEQGVAAPWEAKKVFEEIAAESGRVRADLEPLLKEGWSGAGEVYANQIGDVIEQLRYLERAAREAGDAPESLSKGFAVYFRAESVELLLNSVVEGVRRYRNPALAELLEGRQRDLERRRQDVRRYLAELVEVMERECRVAREEAYRCRVELIQEQPRGSSRRH